MTSPQNFMPDQNLRLFGSILGASSTVFLNISKYNKKKSAILGFDNLATSIPLPIILNTGSRKEILDNSVADPDAGSCVFTTPWSRDPG
jgi:hypothetical protein